MKQKKIGITFSTEKAETYIDLLLQSMSKKYGEHHVNRNSHNLLETLYNSHLQCNKMDEVLF